MDSTTRCVRRNRAARRGVSLIEGMTASVVLLIALVGIFQGLMVASRQNSLANLATRASGVASQARMALDSFGRDRVVGVTGTPGLLTGSACTTDASVLALAGGMEKLKPSAGEAWAVRCIFDLDASEKAKATASRLLPSYSDSDFNRYRRIVVMIEKPDEMTGVTMHQLTVVVSWMELGRRRFVRQYFSFYDPSASFGNGTNIEI